MKRAILFRYHDRFDVCANRIALLRRFNPDVPVYGMYGGAPTDQTSGLDLNDDYALPFSDPTFKWQHGDLCARQWFRDRGQKFPFAMLHIVEWDLVLLEPIDRLFASITDGVGISQKSLLDDLRKTGWGWIARPDKQDQFAELSKIIADKYGKALEIDRLWAGVFPGACMSRAFLERYAGDDIPALLHDEIRMTLYAHVYGFPVHDTGLSLNNTFWNCSGEVYTPEQVCSAALTNKIFHPVREILPLNVCPA